LERSYYDEYFLFEQDNWWFVSRRRILSRVLRDALPHGDDREVLDAGCGTGINLSLLKSFGRVTGIDCSPDAIRFCAERGHRDVIQGDLRSLDLPDARFDLVTALDVIEHIDDDAATVREMVRVTKPGGHLLITVPAFPGLWSDHDEINHHRRRYRSAELRSLVEAAGCGIVKFSCMNTVLFPLAYAVRTYQQLRRRLFGPPAHGPRTDFVDYHPVVNRALGSIFSSEAPLVSGPGLPFGLSLLCLARKQ
jgi:SAM-dependent methyltransferase